MKIKNENIEKNILIAFLLNIFFSIIELFGGFYTNSVSIIQDSLHDFTDAISIGISYFLEKKSKKKVDNKYTFGYIRFSVLGGVITTTILLVSSILLSINSIKRIMHPEVVNYNGMLFFALFGIIINIAATIVTKDGSSINQKSVNLHMMEDVLGWIVVFIGSIIMHITDISVIDPLMSIGVSIYIMISSFKNLKVVLDIFLEKTPDSIDLKKIKKELLKIEDVDDIHHIHVWSIDGYNNYATMHIVTKAKDIKKIKNSIRKKLEENNICHSILETEEDMCNEIECNPITNNTHSHHHSHHH